MARNQPSKVDRLPGELREAVADLRRGGRTIDEILVKLRELAPEHDLAADALPSRAGLGVHVKSLDEAQARLAQSRAVADSLVARFGEASDNKLARANIDLMQSVVMQTVMATKVDEETGEASAVTFDPEQTMFLARSLQALAGAEKTTGETIRKAEELGAKRANDAAKKALEVGAKSGAIDPEAAVRAKRILGFD